MQDFSPFSRLIYRFLGSFFYVTYITNRRTFLTLPWGWYIRRLMFVPVLLGLLGRWGQWTWVALGAALLVILLYWLAARLGYSRFVPQKGEAVMWVDEEIRPLAPNQRVPIQATGLFSVRDQEYFVLLQDGHYWQVPLGDHAVMVEHVPQRYVYQFFDAATLHKAQPGWLIFGGEPQEALAVTFRTKWTPKFAKLEVRYYVQSEAEPEAPLRTVYLSFADEADKQRVWQNILQDMASMKA
jgi:hypothetical protein